MATSTERIAPSPQIPLQSRPLLWVCLSLAIAVLYRLPALHNAFSGEFVVQDDARQHVFWMQRFADPGLFPNDFIADYFQSVAPWGYTTLYKAGVALGFDVWTFNKILPVVIAVLATGFAFGTIWELVQQPVAAFVGTVFLNQIFPLRDDVVSATPAAFFHPFFLAFLYFTLRRSWRPAALSIVLMGLFYPQGVLVMAGTLILLGLGYVRWPVGQGVAWHGSRAEIWLIGGGLLAAFFVLLPYALRDSAYGPVLTVEQARTMLALSPQGWSKFFDDDPIDFWLFGKRTGLFPFEWATLDLKVQPQVWLAIALPFLLYLPRRSPLAKAAAPRLSLLLQTTLASVVCFGLAHLLLFELHLPNRYTEHSFRAIAAVAAGAAIALIMDRLRDRSHRPRRRVWWGVLGIWAIAPLIIGLAAGESRGNYIHGRSPELYRFLADQPEATVVTSVDPIVNEIPSFSQRSIFVGGEGFVLPYHLGYYDEMKTRTVALIEAHYTDAPASVAAFLDTYESDLWLVSPAMFTPEWIDQQRWLRQYADATDAPQRMLTRGTPAVVQSLIPACQEAQFDEFIVLPTSCLRDALPPSPSSPGGE